MKSAVPKVLHRIAGRSLLAHVASSAVLAGADAIGVVVGPGRDDVAAEARGVVPGVEIFVQAERNGTAHAVLAAREAIERGYDDVLILYADVPLVGAEILRKMRAAVAAGAAVVALGFETADPQGYGRLVIRDGELLAIREHKDASPAERTITLCNSGLMALAGEHALAILGDIGRDNAQGEYYLTDAVEAARARTYRCVALATSESEVMGVNDRVQLAAAEAVMQGRLRAAVMRQGATLIAPETVFLSHDTRLGQDVVVEPHVVFGLGVVVEDGALVHAFSHLEGAHVGPAASIGPFGRLRPGAQVGKGARIGNFVELKNAAVEDGAKINHLTYIGDARVGAGANIGAGTITCNYDGFSKFHTEIGAGAFVGSNSSLVAPIKIGAGAYVASGSVITDDVPADALAFGRSRQSTKEGRAALLRAERSRKP